MADIYRRALHVAQGTPLTERDLRRMNTHGSWPRIADGLQYLYDHVHQVPAIVVPAASAAIRSCTGTGGDPRSRDKAGTPETGDTTPETTLKPA